MASVLVLLNKVCVPFSLSAGLSHVIPGRKRMHYFL